MPNLKCNVTNCEHNCSRLCSLNEIKVQGETASTSDSTCCGSFHDATGRMKNAMESDASLETSIACRAENCQHNENCQCHADGIEVCGCGAKKSESTECSTFICR